jgi:isochorismate synthase EntC
MKFLMNNDRAEGFIECLRQGAVYGRSGEPLTFFWGKSAQARQPESYPAVFTCDFLLTEKKPWHSYLYTLKEDPPFSEDHQASAELLEWTPPSFELFREQFLEAQTYLASGEISKVVLTTKTEALKTIEPQQFIQNALLQTHQNTFVYGQWDEHAGFLGFTPELLLQMKNDTELHTMALAGTVSLEVYKKNPDLLFSEKNKYEHQLVVEDIVNCLNPFGKVTVQPLEALSLDTLVHLYTPISVELNEAYTFENYVQALHPTPALGISPRSQAPLLKFWRFKEGSFGAPFAVSDSEQNIECVVGIRNLSWNKNKYTIRCGCGVVKDSQLEDEWNELLLKIEAVKKIFTPLPPESIS